MIVLSILFWIIGLVLSAFSFYQFAFFIISLFSRKKDKHEQAAVSVDNKFAVIIPAHNEELLIGGLVESINRSDYPQDKLKTYVTADNCSDGTAEIATAAGAECRIREDLDNRGKPYALNWLISNIDLDEHDAYVIIDADTIVDINFFREMNISLEQGHKVVQGYFGVMNPDENWLTRLSILPGILKFYLHFPAKNRLGLSCPLAGNGMCFHNSIFKEHGWNAYSIAENWEYYIQLALAGKKVVSNENAVIYSQVTNNLKSGVTQRQRWQSGRMDTVSRYWRDLLDKYQKTKEFYLVDALIEVVRPSHAILFFGSTAFFLITAALFVLAGVSYLSLFILSIAILLSQVLYFLYGLVLQKAPMKTWLSLLMVPYYLLWKFIISVKGAWKKKEKEWVRTKRH
ncbi:MAG: glycosyltransferase [Candidatus Thiodiazotropha sp. (ex Ctena orbiculata)]|nr:glycosyltransferase [Candidatus Thiodiazotropha taylori]MBT2997498.1 glycosyltransferase [Candidatus Thiodiazotropha taylori]MBT3001172.1 glycosyltransferase [Candidatus Thiodiazotropha taylori]MBV2107424.1 glycosyltransferase [Candidatus Thiodiazotropha taylori]MBV2112020.1 glycosyltransferase [Candidatus Thiodiazotropha taylori]